MSRGACINDAAPKKEPKPMPATLTNVWPKGDVRGSQPDDLFVDETSGKLWRVVAYYPEPVVAMEAVEAEPVSEPSSGSTVIDHQSQPLMRPKQTIEGGISGHMWTNFRRIWRKAEPYRLN